ARVPGRAGDRAPVAGRGGAGDRAAGDVGAGLRGAGGVAVAPRGPHLRGGGRMSPRGHGLAVMFYARLVAAQLKMSVLTALQYRLGFWTEGVLGLLWSALGIAPLFIAVEHLGSVEGWGRGELVVLTGCFTMLSGLFTA